LPGKPKTILQAGRYLYCGSAKGSGGIRARLSRHMRPGKVIHWHVDLLTAAGRVTGAWIFPRCDECELVRALSCLPAPIRGFGSTDCPKCWSHLLSWPRRARAEQTSAAERANLRQRLINFGCMSKCATTICLARDGYKRLGLVTWAIWVSRTWRGERSIDRSPVDDGYRDSNFQFRSRSNSSPATPELDWAPRVGARLQSSREGQLGPTSSTVTPNVLERSV
jgi:Uri superfamily endonuclease